MNQIENKNFMKRKESDQDMLNDSIKFAILKTKYIK